MLVRGRSDVCACRRRDKLVLSGTADKKRAMLAHDSFSSDPSGVDSPKISEGCYSNKTIAAAIDTVPHWWGMMSGDERALRTANAHKAWDLVFFVHGLSFALIDSRLLKEAIQAIKRCPTFELCCRQTLAGSHLDARDEDANAFKAERLRVGIKYGFLFTSDGWKSTKRKTYHN